MNRTRLDALAERLSVSGIDVTVDGDSSVEVVDVDHDSRGIAEGSLFCCVTGANTDGHDHASAAVAAGAVALVTRRPLDLGVPELRVSDVRRAMGPLAARVHGDPSRAMTMVGVTGTNGKTSTVSLIEAIGRAAGKRVGVVGTMTGERTTPEAPELQRRLAAYRDEGCTLVAMEVSSHALVQHRVEGTHFDLAVFTNLSPDHLDFHLTMEEYFRAKAELFEPTLADRAAVNIDDAHGRLLLDASVIPTVGFSRSDAEPVDTLTPLTFVWRGRRVETRLAGRFNVENAVAAATASSLIGVDDDTIRDGLETADPIPGRFEMIPTDGTFTVIVDFAHTPDGLEKVLESAREIAGTARVLVVFGAGGDRDRSKRPLMGAAAERGADVVVLTNDNPRSEDPATIIDEIRAGMAPGARVDREPDRRRAIARVIRDARAGDVVVVAGKGHEQTQTIGAVATPFDDRVVAREELERSGHAS